MKEKREHQEEELRWRVMDGLSNARNVTFALEIQRELPMTKEDYDRQKKNKPPDWPKMNKAREAMLEGQKKHFEGISSAWHYAEYIGIPNPFDPPKEVVKTSQEFKEQDQEARRVVTTGVMGRLQDLVDAGHGSATFHDLS